MLSARFGSILLASIFVFSGSRVLAEEGVSEQEIQVGMSNAESGPASALGIGMMQGSEAFFKKVNAGGGVAGRKIHLITRDDSYEPAQAVGNTDKLIHGDKVFALFGYVGTPTSTAVMPLVGRADIPYVAPFTGAELLRNPVNKNVYNVRASYFDETDTIVQYLVGKLKIRKIGVFIQDDAYGSAGEAGVRRALRKRDMAIAGKGIYSRNTTDVDRGLSDLRRASPQAVIMVCAYKACAAFIKKAKASGFNPKFINISFVGTAALIRELGSKSEGVIISQVMPLYTDKKIPIVKQYQADMKASGHSSLDYTSLEGYIGARVFAEGLKKAGRNLTRASFRAAMDHLRMDLGGFKVSFSPTSHSGSSKVYLTVVKRGQPQLLK